MHSCDRHDERTDHLLQCHVLLAAFCQATGIELPLQYLSFAMPMPPLAAKLVALHCFCAGKTFEQLKHDVSIVEFC